MLLAIDTSGRYAGLALAQEGRTLYSLQWYVGQSHTVGLLPAISGLLQKAGAALEKLEAIAVARGPGGFSALRVGLSVAKGLCFAAGTPLVAVHTLEAEAWSYRWTSRPLCPMLDAGRDEMVWGIWEGDNGQLLGQGEERVGPLDALLEALPARALVCGEGVERHGAALKQRLPSGVVLEFPYVPSHRLAGVVGLGTACLEAGQWEDVAALQPRYARRPSITSPSRPFSPTTE